MKRYIVTGDTHGHTIERIEKLEAFDLAPSETSLIILGDAGFNFYLNKTDAKNKREVNARGYRIYCVRGNHEARPENIPGMRVEYDTDIRGEILIEDEYPNIRYLLNGHIYWFGVFSALVINGAYSVDKWYRLQRAGLTGDEDPEYIAKKAGWFADEQLSDEEMRYVEYAVDEINSIGAIDFVLSHTCPYSFRPIDLFLPSVSQDSVDNTMEHWLENIKDALNWKYWLFGHYHADRLNIVPGVSMLYTGLYDLRELFYHNYGR